MIVERIIACIALYVSVCVGINLLFPDKYAAMYPLLQAVFFSIVVATLAIANKSRRTAPMFCLWLLGTCAGLEVVNGAVSAWHYWDIPLTDWCAVSPPSYDAFTSVWSLIVWGAIVAFLTKFACNINR